MNDSSAYHDFVKPRWPQVDVDYVELWMHPDVLPSLSVLELTIGPLKRDFVSDDERFVLVAYNAGFVYVPMVGFDKTGFVRLLSYLFGYEIQPANDPTVLLRSLNRRIAPATLARLLVVMRVNTVVYINYGMKAPLMDYAYLYRMSDKFQKVVIDIGVNDHIPGKLLLCQSKKGLPRGCCVDFELFSSLQYPSGGRPFGTSKVANPPPGAGYFMARVYSNSIHVVKSKVQAAFVQAPRDMRGLRRYEDYYERAALAMLLQEDSCCTTRTEIRVPLKSSIANQVEHFMQVRSAVYELLKFRVVRLDEVLAMASSTLKWAKEVQNLFRGTNTNSPSRRQVLVYHVVNNAHGVVAQGGNSAVGFARKFIVEAYKYAHPPVVIEEETKGGDGDEETKGGDVDEETKDGAVDEETKGEEDLESEVHEEILLATILDCMEGSDEEFENALLEDHDGDDFDEEENERLRRFAPLAPEDVRESVETSLLIKKEGRGKRAVFVVRKHSGTIWRRSKTKEALIEATITELNVDWREYLQMKGSF